MCLKLGKKALLGKVGERNPDPEIAKLEEENINSISLATTVGEEKFGGSTYIKEYFAAKDPASAAAINASSTIMAPTETKGSILSVFKQKVKLFKQGKAPLISTKGKLLIGKDKLIKEASDGNGSIYQSLAKNGILEDMKQNNIKWVFVGGVDNILLRIVDPLLIGVTVSENNEIASKSVIKITPKERAGVFCKIDEKPGIIEYSELPEEMAEKVDENGDLVYGDVNILSHLFSIDALEKLAKIQLPYHIAEKKSDYLDENGILVKPDNKNVYKYESFIFDAFSNFDEMSILRVKRENEFAPIKNAEGVDSPETAVELYNATHGDGAIGS